MDARIPAIAGLVTWSLLAAAPARAQNTVSCESDGTYKYCRVETFGKATLVNEISSGACVGGTTWAYDRHGIWVDKGCRAEFKVNEAWEGGKPGGSEKPAPDPGAKVPKWAIGSFSAPHPDWDTPFTLTISADGIAKLTTTNWEAWGYYLDGLVRFPGPGSMTYQLKKGPNGAVQVISLINRNRGPFTLARAMM